ncbi:uncharacterized protein Z518_05228 [Rhinocladiella mackenziei CBS 650.93]|uniref:Protein YTP1-like C-terminal domain-containing protein n=1 Tax=Rhinocladiella mackenziei CBS 650.93 TaxID=1442369 RepID=A0A0D2J5M8_9EURO|nr:uncharacterized protein Z518_05228 [Rhinocladiella mackenziei CBS 650.93]KIX04360.1 hypothetical protein Z518_05228 [Rhinocladiella mackenziei CBS 650.93]
MFMEHITGWGGRWTASDLEHVSIAIMFFGAGLCGLLIESPTIRSLLNARATEQSPREADSDDNSVRANPLPALTLLLLGLVISSHHQDSELAVKVHYQFGMFLIGFAACRLLTYVLWYSSPPKSSLPSRPLSKFMGAFCAMAAGLTFLAAARDVLQLLDAHDIMVTLVFAISASLTLFLMSWTLVLLGLMNWISKKQAREGEL